MDIENSCGCLSWLGPCERHIAEERVKTKVSKLGRLEQAIQYYQSSDCRYTYIETPWFCTKEVVLKTAPAEANPFYVRNSDKALVGSAEQGFLQLLIDNQLPPGKYCSFSPCFRGDKEDDLHQQQFYKVELFQNVDVNEASLQAMIINAKFCMDSWIKTSIVKTELGWDLVSSKLGIELGSYGIRYVGNSGTGLSYVFGTGLAEPRLSIAIEKEHAQYR